jgi:hypothetical protein
LFTSRIGTAFQKQIIEGKIEGRIQVTGRRWRRREQLLYDLKETREHCQLKEEALARTMWRTGFARGCRPVVRQTKELMTNLLYNNSVFREVVVF